MPRRSRGEIRLVSAVGQMLCTPHLHFKPVLFFPIYLLWILTTIGDVLSKRNMAEIIYLAKRLADPTM